MHPIIKQEADRGDLRSLKNIFVIALDEDPTFENYQEGYDYIRSKGLLEPHRELTPFTEDSDRWTEDYWVQLETDLAENFSEKRMEHMKRVAQVFLKDKIERLRVERAAAQQQKEMSVRAVKKDVAVETALSPIPVKSETDISLSEQEKLRFEESRRKQAEEYARKKAEIEKAEQERKERVKMQPEQQPLQGGSPSSKKASGIAAIAAAAVILATIIALVMILTTEVLALGNSPEPQAGCILPAETVIQAAAQIVPAPISITALQMEEEKNCPLQNLLSGMIR